MAKKKFSKGLDGLFTDAWEEEIEKDPFLGTEVDVKEEKAKLKTSDKPRKRGRKNFTSDLDSLLDDALEDSSAHESSTTSMPREENTTVKKRRRYRKPLRGLNALIRQTLEPEFYEIEDDKKRVTFIYKKSRYKKLKKIAKREDLYIKDVIGRVLNQYIKMYEEERGKLN